MNVHYGACFSAGQNWLNFDSSPSLWLQRLPVVGRFVKIDGRRFPDELIFGDIVRGLPVPDGAAHLVFASHVLEHMPREDCRAALANTLRMLAPGGVFRLIVPDLRERARRYVEAADAEAADRFLDETFLGRRSRPHGVVGRLRAALGNSAHDWMWDEASMRAELERAGFVAIRRCAFGDSANPALREVENPDRYIEEVTGVTEVALECRRPL